MTILLSFIFFLFIFALVIVLMVTARLMIAWRNMKNKFSGNKNQEPPHQYRTNEQQEEKKIFSDYEGEYVDYEEIKD